MCNTLISGSCLKEKTQHLNLITEAICRENVCLLRETKHVFKKLGTEHDIICYVSTFGLALQKLERGFIGCGSFHQPGDSVMNLFSPPFILWLRELDAT